MTSKETKKYIHLVEKQEHVRHGIDAAFDNARQMPIVRGGKNRFWLISDPSGPRASREHEYNDTVSLVDTGGFGNIAKGSVPHHLDYNYELHPEADESAAKRDAYNRWMSI